MQIVAKMAAKMMEGGLDTKLCEVCLVESRGIGKFGQALLFSSVFVFCLFHRSFN
jgi:hypothetical protein